MQTRFKRYLASLALVGATALVGLSPVQASADTQAQAPTPVSGVQAKPAVEAGSKDRVSPKEQPRGATQLKAVDANGKLVGATPRVGNDSSVDFSSVYNYCQGNLVYTPVHNYSSVTKYFEVVLYEGSTSRTYYTSVAAGGTAYPYWYGVTGTYYAYLYVWNGSSYAYDQYETSANNCAVSVTLNTNSGYTGYVLMTIKNTGNAYASVESNELAPYPGSGTYTGLHWDYPAAGGGTIYRYYYVGTGLKYGIFADLYGASFYTPWYWYGQL